MAPARRGRKARIGSWGHNALNARILPRGSRRPRGEYGSGLEYNLVVAGLDSIHYHAATGIHRQGWGTMRIQAFAMGLALALASVGGARATTDVRFTITGGDRTATFELPLSPTPTFGVPGVFFTILSVSATIGGSPTTLTNVSFWDEALGGGFVADSLFNFSGQFYTGSESSPTFVPGVYRSLLNEDTQKIDTVTVTELPTTVSDPPPVIGPPDPPVIAVPELSTWAMLLLGFLSLGYAGYRKASRDRRVFPRA
jgi:hypothetical protein